MHELKNPLSIWIIPAVALNRIAARIWNGSITTIPSMRVASHRRQHPALRSPVVASVLGASLSIDLSSCAEMPWKPDLIAGDAGGLRG
jgi:hypothetical protein